MSDYEIVWDGSHNGRDTDLLGLPAQLEKRHAITAPIRHRDGRQQVWLALAVTRETALTFRELVQRTGLPRQTVNSALYELRQRGALQSETLPGCGGWRGRPPQRYWRSADVPRGTRRQSDTGGES
jgi:predicted ArsR family transcriptional regulator